jgi:hypothetical protein
VGISGFVVTAGKTPQSAKTAATANPSWLLEFPQVPCRSIPEEMPGGV